MFSELSLLREDTVWRTPNVVIIIFPPQKTSLPLNCKDVVVRMAVLFEIQGDNFAVV